MVQPKEECTDFGVKISLGSIIQLVWHVKQVALVKFDLYFEFNFLDLTFVEVDLECALVVFEWDHGKNYLG